MPKESLPEDPLGLGGAEQEIRIEKLKHQIEDVTGQEMQSGKTDECDPALEEAFLQNVLELETHGFVRPLEVFTREGLSLPTPGELDDKSLGAKLHELIRAMAARRLFLHSTDHLSDRELYTWLLEEGLKEELMGFGMPFGNCHLDVIGSGSEEDVIVQMRYYADDEERAEWAAQFPDFPMPPRQPKPFDRDRSLPKSDYGA